jgi:hypothetical protein
MNKMRRTALNAVIAKYTALYNQLDDLGNEFDTLKDELEAIKDEEQEAYDNLPESMQGGEKGDTMMEGINRLEDAIANLESITEFCQSNDSSEFTGYIEEAQNG